MQQAEHDDDFSLEARTAIAFHRLETVLCTPTDPERDPERDRDRDRVSLALRSLESVINQLISEGKLKALPPVTTEEDGRLTVRPSRPESR